MDDEESVSTDDHIHEMLDLQLSELEMLRSMFPRDDELKLDDQLALVNIQSYLSGQMKYEYLHSRLGFNLQICPEHSTITLELVCQLPHDYPSAAPVVFTRAPNMDKNNHRKLNEDLQEFILSLDRGEICLYSIVEWIQEHLENYQSAQEENTHDLTKKQNFTEDTTFSRIWIYSHHIYSKFKRKDILDWAHELQLTGFSLPGKPGVICAEGYSRPVDEYWNRLRRLNWKRLAMKDKEEIEIEDGEIKKLRKFENFEEKVFDARGGKGRVNHMDLGQLYEFLKSVGCGDKFQMYFGVEGKASTF